MLIQEIMREIEFRGKYHTDNLYDEELNRVGKWFYGLYILDYGHPAITNSKDDYRIIPETLGQYIGLKDINDIKIYEGDLVSNGYTATYTDGQTNRFFNVGVVEYDSKNTCFVIRNFDGKLKRITANTIIKNQIEVIGNIHDNPELFCD